MTTKEINILLNLVGASVQEVAERANEKRAVVSQTINYERVNARARKNICRAVGAIVAEKLFDESADGAAASR